MASAITFAGGQPHIDGRRTDPVSTCPAPAATDRRTPSSCRSGQSPDRRARQLGSRSCGAAVDCGDDVRESRRINILVDLDRPPIARHPPLAYVPQPLVDEGARNTMPIGDRCNRRARSQHLVENLQLLLRRPTSLPRGCRSPLTRVERRYHLTIPFANHCKGLRLRSANSAP
jgi:hypothetical protein